MKGSGFHGLELVLARFGAQGFGLGFTSWCLVGNREYNPYAIPSKIPYTLNPKAPYYLVTPSKFSFASEGTSQTESAKPSSSSKLHMSFSSKQSASQLRFNMNIYSTLVAKQRYEGTPSWGALQSAQDLLSLLSSPRQDLP